MAARGYRLFSRRTVGGLSHTRRAILLTLCFLGLCLSVGRSTCGQPGNGATGVEVSVDLQIVEITEIDDVGERFTLVGYLALTWTPELLDRQPPAPATYIGADAEAYLDRIPWPDPFFTNQITDRETQQLNVRVDEQGTVFYDERFRATLSVNLDLARFPFDRQMLPLGLKCYDLSSEAFILVPGKVGPFRYARSETEAGDMLDGSVFGDAAPTPVPSGWILASITSERVSVESAMWGRAYSCIEIRIHIDRSEGFYIWRILLPLVLIVIVSWAGFWMRGESTGSRMTASLFGFLSAITFGFMVSDALPRLPSLTFLDILLAGTYGLVALAVIENILSHVLRTWRDDSLAHRMDVVSRWLFPAVYALFLIVSVIVIQC